MWWTNGCVTPVKHSYQNRECNIYIVSGMKKVYFTFVTRLLHSCILFNDLFTHGCGTIVYRPCTWQYPLSWSYIAMSCNYRDTYVARCTGDTVNFKHNMWPLVSLTWLNRWRRSSLVYPFLDFLCSLTSSSHTIVYHLLHISVILSGHEITPVKRVWHVC